MWQPLNIYAPGYPWREHHIKAPADAKLEDILKPETWAHVASRLTPLDTIVVKAETGLFAAAFHVVSAKTDGATVFPLWVADMSAGSAGATVKPKSKIVVEFVTAHKWRLVRDKDVLAYGFASKEDAEAKVADFE